MDADRPGLGGAHGEVGHDDGYVPGLGDHRIGRVYAALADAGARMGVHIADDAALIGVAKVPELAVGEAVEADAAVRQPGSRSSR